MSPLVIDRIELEKRVKWYEHRYGPYIDKRGFGNWKNLFRKPTIHEWTILFMLLMAFFIAWAYQIDISACSETLENIGAVCANLNQPPPPDSTEMYGSINLSEFIITADNLSLNEG